MSRYALFVELKPKPGREDDVAAFLAGARPLVEQETATVSWFAGRLDARTFMIFDSFDEETGRDAHLTGAVAQALMANAEALLSEAPKIHKIDLLASKIP